MLNCPKCGSTKLHRSHTRSAWERWRREITTKCPFRCHRCGWRGWKSDPGPLFSREEVEAANRALTKPPVDASSLNVEVARPVRTPFLEEQTHIGGAAEQKPRRQDPDIARLDQVFSTSGATDHQASQH